MIADPTSPSEPPYFYVVGLGSNLGNRLEYLHRAARLFTSISGEITVSSVYETEPWGPPQPYYLNAALRCRSECTPEVFLAELLGFERSLGRDRARSERWGAREIDLDILWFSGGVVHLPNLTIPHPRLTERAFVLVPLLEVLPDPTYTACLQALNTAPLRVFREPDHWYPTLHTIGPNR